MHRTRFLRHGWRLLAVVILGLGLFAGAIPRAYADPSTNDHRVVAEEVAASVCRTVPRIPKLPVRVEPNTLCRSVLVENIDPDGNNSGVRAACEVGLPVLAKAATRYCVQVMDRLLDPARKLFLAKVVPAVQQLACVTSTPAAFDCLAQQVHVWLKQSIISLWQGLVTVLTADTKAISLLDGWRNAGIVSLYSDIGGLGATVLLGLMITSLIISMIRFDFRQFGHTLLGVVVWGMFWSGGAVLAVLLLKTSDDAARWLGGRPDGSGQTDLARAGRQFGNWVDYVTGASAVVPGGVHPVYNPGSFTAILICLLLIVAIVVTLVALLMRNIALLLLIVLLPLTLAGTAGPRMTREWFVAALRMFVALLLAKPLIVVAVRLGAVLVSVPNAGEAQATFSDAILGVTIILLAGLLPGVIYRFSGGLVHTSAGAAPRASGGVTEQSAQSAQSSMDITRMIMERNAPRSALATGTTGNTATAGGAGVVGGRVGAAGGGLGAAAGPLGVAALATVVAAGALESGGRWLGGQAATAGGVFGDVDAPRVPAPPVSRLGQYGTRQLAGTQSDNRTPDHGRIQEREAGLQQGQVTVMRSEPATPARTGLPAGGPPLIIPGTVVPQPVQAEPPPPPRALTAGADEPPKDDR